MTQCLFSIRTISRSNSTVVVSVSCEKLARGQKMEAVVIETAAMSNEHRFMCAQLRRRNDLEREGKGVQPVVTPELSPGAVASGFRHQALESHIGTAAQLFQIGGPDVAFEGLMPK